MSSDRLRTQIQFESSLSAAAGIPWSKLTNSQVSTYSISATDKALYDSQLREDSIDFFYKGVRSLIESLISANQKWFSWSTVKIYYSVFYLLRSSLCSKNIAFIRKERDAYYFQNSIGNSPIKVPGTYKTDHKGAIYLFKTFFNGTDFLQSNSINGENPYEWLMKNRENINYKFRTFYEPDIPLFWDSISSSFDTDGIQTWLDNYIKDDIYCFLEDHAIIALPIRRLILTYQDLKSSGISPPLHTAKFNDLENILKKESFLKSLKPYFI